VTRQLAAFRRSEDPRALLTAELTAALDSLRDIGRLDAALLVGLVCLQRIAVQTGADREFSAAIALDVLVPHHDRDPAALPAAMGAAVESLAGTADTTEPHLLHVRADIQWRRYHRDGLGSTRDDAIDLMRRAMTAAGPADPLAYRYTANLANALRQRLITDRDERTLREVIYLRLCALGHAGCPARRRRQLRRLIRADYTTLFTLTGDRSTLQALSLVRLPLRLGRHLDDLLWQQLYALARPAAEPWVVEDLLAIARRRTELPAPGGRRADYLSHLCLSLLIAFDADGTPDRLDAAVDAARRSVEAAGDRHPKLHHYLANLATTLRRGGVVHDDRVMRREAVEVGRRALARVRAGQPDHLSLRGDLGVALFLTVADHTPIDLSVARAAADHARAALAEADRRLIDLPTLAGALAVIAENDGDPRVLDEAIDRHRESLALPLGAARRPVHLLALSRLLVLRAAHAGTGGNDAVEAVDACREVFASSPAADIPRRETLLTYAAALVTLAQFGPSPDAIDDAIATTTTLLELGEEDLLLPARSRLHMCRFDLTGELSDLDASIGDLHEALRRAPLDHPERGEMLGRLGTAYRQRCKATGSAADLDTAVDLGRDAIAAHPRRAYWLAHLTAHLRERFDLSGHRADLEEAIAWGREALTLRPDPETEMYARTHLGSALRSRHDATGDRRDLDEAIAHGRAAVAAIPPDRPQDGISARVMLASALLTRYDLWDVPEDLDQGVELARAALALTGERDVQRPIRSALVASALRLRFQKHHDRDDRAAALTHAEHAYELSPPGSPQRVDYLTTLLATYLGTHRAGEDGPDLDRLIALAEAALPTQTTVVTMLLANLGTLYGRRDDRERAVAALRQALALTGADHPQRAGCCLRLSERLGDVPEALRLAREAARCGNAPAETRLYAAYRWARLAPHGSIEPHREVIELLTLTAWHGAPRSVREERLARWGSVSSMAVASVLDGEEPELAVELLDQGRGVLWSQLLDARSELDAVARRDGDLARRLRHVRTGLDRPSSPIAEAGH
jgi:tetratricopeptide (TPR) repeat protein